MQVAVLDHLVLTVRDLDASIRFYTDVLGMTHEVFGEDRHALRFGRQKINLHQLGHEFSPRAAFPTPGSADLCFLTDASVEDVLAHLRKTGCIVEEGPVERDGAAGQLLSVYVRDPDSNLVEIAHVLS